MIDTSFSYLIWYNDWGFYGSVPFIESGSQVDLDCWPLETWGTCLWVGIIGINDIIFEIHHDNLRISSFSSWGDLSVNQFCSNISIVFFKVVSKAWGSIIIGLPNHSLAPGMVSIISPIVLVVNIKLGFCILDKSISVIDTWSDSQIDWASSSSFVQIIKSIIKSSRKLKNISQSISPGLSKPGHCIRGSSS